MWGEGDDSRNKLGLLPIPHSPFPIPHSPISQTMKQLIKESASILVKSLLCLTLINISACKNPKSPEKPPETNQTGDSGQENVLLLNNATLEQSNKKGQIAWKINVNKAIYSQEKKDAKLDAISGELYQDAKSIVAITATSGAIEDKGEILWLKGKIVATDKRNGAILKADEAEWRPDTNLLVIKGNIQGTHPNLQATAKEGRYHTQEERLELIGNIDATGKDPDLTLKTEHLSWFINKKKVIGDKPVQISRYSQQQITDQMVSDRVNLDLNTKTANLQQNVELKSVDPPVQIATNLANVNLKTRMITVPQPIQILHNKEQITVTGNQGQFDLAGKKAYLRQGVQGISERNQAKLYADNLNWNVATQIMEAYGNVIYQQIDPLLSFTGSKAVGILQQKNIVVSSQQGKQVVTEIIP